MKITTKKLLEILDNRNITQAELVKANIISNGTMTQWKQGKTNPSEATLAKIAKYIDEPIEIFYGQYEEKPLTEISSMSDEDIKKYASNFFTKDDLTKLTEKQNKYYLILSRNFLMRTSKAVISSFVVQVARINLTNSSNVISFFLPCKTPSGRRKTRPLAMKFPHPTSDAH